MVMFIIQCFHSNDEGYSLLKYDAMMIGNFLPMFWEDLDANTFTIVKEYVVDGRICCLIEGNDWVRGQRY
jgi:hypothetical protein